MLKAKVEYLGQSEYGKNDRYAVITTPKGNDKAVSGILDELGYEYEGYGDSEESFFWVKVEDRNDYKFFMNDWKKAKKAYNA